MRWLKDSRFMDYMEKLNRNEYVEEKRTDHASRANPHISRNAARRARAAYSCSLSAGKRKLLRPISGTP